MRVPPFVFVESEHFVLRLLEQYLQNPIFISLAINAERIFPNGDFSTAKAVPTSLERSKATPFCDKEISSAYEAMIIGKSIEYIFVCEY